MSLRSSQSRRNQEPPDAPSEAPRPPGCFTRLLLPALATYFVIRVVAAFARPDYLPAHDGPHHILSAWLTAHASDPGSGYLHFLEPGRPLTALGFIALFRLFEPALGWQGATSAVLGCIIALWSVGGLLLARKVEPNREWLGLLAAATAGQWTLYMGFFPFAIGLGLSLFVLLAALSRDRLSWPVVFTTGALLTLVALCHVAVAAMTGLAVVAIFVARERPSRRMRGVVGAMVAGLPAAVIATLTASGIGAVEAAYQGALSAPPWPTSLGDRFFLLARCFTPGTTDRELTPVTLALAGVAFTVLGIRARRARPLDIALASMSLLLFGLALLSPANLFGWQFFAPRPVPLAVMLGLLALPIERLGRLSRLVFCSWLIWFTVGSIQWTEAHNRALDASAKPAIAGLHANLHRTGARLPLIADPIGAPGPVDGDAVVPFAQPLLNTGLLYIVAQGGMAPYFFANIPQGHPFVFKGSLETLFPPVPARDFWRILREPTTPENAPKQQAVLSLLASFGTKYEDIIFFGTPADADAIVARGFEPVVRQDGLLVARFRGCPMELEVESRGSAGKLRAEMGWFPALTPTWSDAADVSTEGSGGLSLTRFTPADAPCGSVWLRVFADRDGDGEFQAAESRCEGSAPDGRFLVRRDKAGPVRCRLAHP